MLCSVVAVALANVSLATASTIVLDATNRGKYYDSGEGVFGLHSANSTSTANYAVGDPLSDSHREHRNFFVFDLTAISDTILGAELRLFNPTDGFGTTQSDDNTETLEIYDVSTSISDLLSGADPTATFGDLASGTVFGTRVVSVVDNHTVIVITLNANALAALNSASGSFAFGGAITSLLLPFLDEREQVFGYSSASSDTRLALFVPEPTTFALLAVGFLVLAFAKRRSK